MKQYKINNSVIYNYSFEWLKKHLLKFNIKADLILTDPPYNISRKNNFKTINRAGIDFGSWDYNFSQTKWLKNIDQVLNKNGSILIFNDWQNISKIVNCLKKNNIVVKDLIRWKKNNPMPRNIKRRYVTDFEFIIWGVKSDAKWIFNNNTKNYKIPEYKIPIVNYKNRIHPTQKPIKLLEELIKTHSNKNDIIVDFFSGSGSTMEACLKNKRIFLGSEINKLYFEKSIKKLNSKKDLKVKRSPLFYIGDKYKIRNTIQKILPKKINIFFDIFCGGASIINFVNANKYYLNDINKEVIDILYYLKNNNSKLVINNLFKIIKKFKIINKNGSWKSNKNKYNEIKDLYNKKQYLFDKNLHLFFLIIFGFNSYIRFNSNKKFNIPIGKGYLSSERLDTINSFHNLIKKKKIVFSSNDFNIFFKENKFHKNDLVYLDPPYLISNATYNYEWNIEKEKQLYFNLDRLNENKTKFILSNMLESKGKTNEILKKWMTKYKVIKVNNNFNNCNYQRTKKFNDVELLIKNF